MSALGFKARVDPMRGFFLILEDISPFCGTTDTLCFGLLVTSTLGFKARAEFSLAHILSCTLFLRFSYVLSRLFDPQIQL